VNRFEIGERVVFLREVGGGVVRRIKHNTIFVEDETGFERPFKSKDLGKVFGTNFPIAQHLLQKNTQQFVRNETRKLYIEHKNYWEIDLHFDTISQQYDRRIPINKTHILEHQLNIFKEFYWRAREKKVRRLIVIHGFGKGILREELHLFLIAQPGVDFFDAPYIQYGHGAIQVEIRYKY